MFWGVTLEPGKKYSQVVSNSFHCTMAALEPLPDVKDENKIVSIVIEHQKSEYVLCTLEHLKLYQQPLQLNFVEGEEISFYTTGQGTVHLTGYHVDESHFDNSLFDEEDSSFDEEEEDVDSDDSDEIPKLVSIEAGDLSDSSEEDDDWMPKKGKRKLSLVDVQPKKLKTSAKITEIHDDDDEDDGKVKKKIKELRKELANGKKSSITNGKVEVEEDDENDSDDEDDDEEEEDDDDSDDSDDSEDSEIEIQTPKKEKAKKKSGDDSELKIIGEKKAPKQEKEKKNSTPKMIPEKKNTPKMSPEKKNTPKVIPEKKNESSAKKPEKNQKSSESPKLMTMPGGLTYTDLRIGKGPVATAGKIVHVYYTGKLENGKQFDEVSSGKPFRFRLGKKEVIKGWDLGLQGMRVGGKRNLFIPPALGYGNKKVGNIPANSKLNFFVELKATN